MPQDLYAIVNQTAITAEYGYGVSLYRNKKRLRCPKHESRL
jgi:hypothetical protein